jgi:hypothetical protein
MAQTEKDGYNVEIFCTENMQEHCTSMFLKFYAEVIHTDFDQTKISQGKPLPMNAPEFCLSRYPKLANNYYIYNCEVIEPQV